MSSFTEYHKKWKEENGRGEDSPYKQRTRDELLESADRYLNNTFNDNENMWDKVQSTANNNLNVNSMQTVLNNSQNRIQSIKKFENYIGAKSSAMQSIYQANQEKRIKQEEVRQENEDNPEESIWNKIQEKLVGKDRFNRVPVYRDENGNVDKTKTVMERAQKNYESI